MDFLERMREKPSHVRNQYAFLGALTFTGLIALVWIVSLPARFSGEMHANEVQPIKDETSGLTEFVDGARSQLGALIDGVRSESGIQKTDTTPSTEPTYEDTYTPPSESEVDVRTATKTPPMDDQSTTSSKVILIGTTTKQ